MFVQHSLLIGKCYFTVKERLSRSCLGTLVYTRLARPEWVTLSHESAYTDEAIHDTWELIFELVVRSFRLYSPWLGFLYKQIGD